VKNTSFQTALCERLARAGLSLPDPQLDRLETYAELLERWNQAFNLTALSLGRWPPETVDRLFVEPLAAAVLVPQSPIDWIDIGSGGGSPAIPLKVVRPMTRLRLVESREKKAAFLREIVRSLQLDDATVSTGRIEEVADQWEGSGADLLTVRGVRIEPSLAGAAGRLLKRGGRLLIFSSSAASLTFPDESFQRLTKLELPVAGAAIHVFQTATDLLREGI
jgi:16S rRNA (guanine527-N7)-methyltransferase